MDRSDSDRLQFKLDASELLGLWRLPSMSAHLFREDYRPDQLLHCDAPNHGRVFQLRIHVRIQRLHELVHRHYNLPTRTTKT